jgi:hypothetical protein
MFFSFKSQKDKETGLQNIEQQEQGVDPVIKYIDLLLCYQSFLKNNLLSHHRMYVYLHSGQSLDSEIVKF